MKKLLIILLAGIFIAGCNGNDEEENSNGEDNSNDQAEESNDEDNAEENGYEQQDVYQIGETAEATSSSYGFPYEVTVNDFEITAEEVEGNALEDFYSETSEPKEDSRFAIVNITLKNTGDDSFVPATDMRPMLDADEFINAGELSGIFPELEEELHPGEEVTSNLLYLGNNFDSNEVVYLTYNALDPNREFKFELPVPEE